MIDWSTGLEDNNKRCSNCRYYYAYDTSEGTCSNPYSWYCQKEVKSKNGCANWVTDNDKLYKMMQF